MSHKLFALAAMLLSGFLQSGAQARIEKTWGAPGNDAALSAAATSDGGYILSGLTQSGIDSIGDIIVLKTNAHADTMWTLQYGGPLLEGGNCVIETKDGGFLVAGHTEDFGAKDCDAFLMKLDKSGRREWLKIYGGDEDDIGESVIELPGEGYVIAGITASYGFGGNRHAWFIRTNYSGDTLWTRTYGGLGNEYAQSIVSTPDNGFLAAGFSTSFSANGNEQAWLLRLSGSGDTLWTRLYASTGNSRYHHIIALHGGGYLLAGYTNALSGPKSMGLVVKLDAAGRVIWERTYGGTSDDITLSGVAELPDSKLLFSGTTKQANSAGNAYRLTTHANGEKLSDAILGAPGSFATCIAVQGNSSYLIAGRTPVDGDQQGDLFYVETDNTIAGIPPLHEESPCLYPNPCRDQLTIILPARLANQTTTCTVYDALGRLAVTVLTGVGSDVHIASEQLMAGYYSYRLIAKNGQQFIGNFLVAHE